MQVCKLWGLEFRDVTPVTAGVTSVTSYILVSDMSPFQLYLYHTLSITIFSDTILTILLSSKIRAAMAN